jgi:hypothetical protein
MQTVVETPSYLAKAHKLLSAAQMEEVVNLVSADPLCGEVMEGTGGFRKVRFAIGNKGKSGGVRIIYIYRNDDVPVFLITVYPKNEKGNLTQAERNALKKRTDEIFKSYRR